MIREEILNAMTNVERAELHDLIIDARQYRMETQRHARYDEAARLEDVLCKVRKHQGDFALLAHRPVT